MSKWTTESADRANPVTRPSVQKIDFLVNEYDYSVSEFFETHGRNLPKIVVVTQGFCGEIVDDTFGKDQVFRLHTTSHQKRIIAKASDGQCMYSLPIGYSLFLCVINKNGKVGKPKALQDIVRKHSFPVEVKFAKDQVFHVGSSKTCANRFPKLTLIDAFDEVYFLANPVDHGAIDFRVVQIPLYLSLLRLAVVTGVRDWSESRWEKYNTELNMLVAQSVEFDRTFGNKDIAIYQQDSLKTDTMYSYIEPQTYCSLSSVYETFEETTSESSSNVYEEIGIPKRLSAVLKPMAESSEPMKGLIKGKKEELVTGKPDRNEPDDQSSGRNSTECFAPAVPRPNHGTKMGSLPAIPPRLNPPPAIPPRPNLYANDIPRGTIIPQIQTGLDKMPTPPLPNAEKSPEDTFAVIKTTATPPSNARNVTTTTSSQKVRASAEPDTADFNVARLTMKELADCMETLKLSRYVSVFQENLIDGTILKDLNVDILQTSFGLNIIEAIRLMRFAKEGHIPK